MCAIFRETKKKEAFFTILFQIRKKIVVFKFVFEKWKVYIFITHTRQPGHLTYLYSFSVITA